MYLDYLVKWMVDESSRSIFTWLLQFSLNWKPLVLRNFTVFDRMLETEALKKNQLHGTVLLVHGGDVIV